MPDVIISATYSQQKTGSNQSPTGAAPNKINATQVGDKVIKNTLLVQGTDITLDLGGQITTIGWCWFQNLLNAVAPPSTVPGVITHGGTPGTTQYTYCIVANYSDGSKSISSNVVTNTGAATLTGTNTNIIPFSNVGAA